MSGYAYPYDPTGSSPANLVTNEEHIVANYYNKWKCIIPAFAPFFRKDFVLKDKEADRELIEGIDFYYGHRFEDGSNTTKMPIYGSIMLINPAVSGTVVFEKYQTLGDRYNIPVSEIGKYLSQGDLPNPRNVDWKELMKYPAALPPIDAPSNIEEAIAEDAVTGSLHNLKVRLQELTQEEADKYDALITALGNLEAKVIDHDIDNHSTKSHVHGETAAQLNAVAHDEQVVNATQAYGKTLAELTDAINKMGIQQYHLDNRYETTGGELAGNLFISENNSSIIHNSGATFIDAESGTVKIVTPTKLTIEVPNAEAGKGVGIHAGKNMLTVHSSGAAKKDNCVVYNGYYIIHAGNVERYLPEPSFEDMQSYTANRNGLTWRGNGLSGNPLSVTAVFPKATATVGGIVQLSDNIYDDRTTVAATPFAVRTVGDMEETFVDNTIKINNKPLTNDVTIVKDDIDGLSNVDNTKNSEKPASNLFKAEANKKAAKVHSHTLSDLDGVPYGNTTTLGMIKLTATWGDTTDKAAEMSLYERLMGEYDNTLAIVKSKMPGRFFNVTQFGGYSYLPLPVQGRYGAAGIGANQVAGEVESNGQLVLLRNGSDMVENGVYYSYADFNEDGAIVKMTPTTTEYRPKFLVDAGTTALQISRGNEGVFSLLDSNKQWWVVLTNGTMDQTKHVGCRLAGNPSPAHNIIPLIWKDKVIYVWTDISMNGIRFAVYSINIADIEKGTDVLSWDIIPLTGTSWKGTRQENVEKLVFVAGGQSTDPTAEVMVLREDEGFWGGVNFRHSAQNNNAAVKGDKVRVLATGRPYCSNSSGSTGGSQWTMSFVLDLAGGECEFEDMELMPYRLTKTAMSTPFAQGIVGYPSYHEPNNIAHLFVSKGRLFSYNGQGSNKSPVVATQTPEHTDFFELFRRNKFKAGTNSAVKFIGAYGSAVTSGIQQPIFLPGNKMVVRNRNSGTYALAEYDPNGSYLEVDDGGFGPASYRKIISESQYTTYSRIPCLFKQDGTVIQEGCVIDRRFSQFATQVLGETAGRNYQCAASVVQQLNDEMYALAFPSGNPLTIKSTAAAFVYGDPANPLGVFAIFYDLTYNSADKTSKRSTRRIYKAQLVLDGTNITRIIPGDLVELRLFNTSATDLARDCSDGLGGVMGMELDDGRWCFISNTHPYTSYVGHGGSQSMATIQNTPGSDESFYTLAVNVHTSNAYGHIAHPKFGLGAVYYHGSGEGIFAKPYGKTIDEIKTGIKERSLYLMTSRVAAGWVVYFTEEVPLYYNFEVLRIPTNSIDITTLGIPYRNTTLYIYVVVNGRTPSYEIRSTRTVDTDNEFYIGYLQTDNNLITKLEVERFTRLGRIMELEEHDDNPKAHGYDGLPKSGKETYGLQYMENYPLLSSAVIPTFGDIFDSWYRFSHQGLPQPAKPAELSTWQYNKDTDSIINLTNSESLIGMVSLQEFGDYDLTTIVSSTNADDDWIGVVIAFVEEGGREHTLTALVSGTDTRSYKYSLHYNFGQSGGDANTNGWIIWTENVEGGLKNGWDTLGKCRIEVERRGNKFGIFFDGFTAQPTIAPAYIELDLDSDPRLSKFKGAVRYGYCAWSQASSTWEKIVTPEENLGAAYASYNLGKEIKEENDIVVHQPVRKDVESNKTVLINFPSGVTSDNYHCKYELQVVSKLGTVETGGWLPKLTYTQGSSSVTVVLDDTITNPTDMEIIGNITYIKK